MNKVQEVLGQKSIVAATVTNVNGQNGNNYVRMKSSVWPLPLRLAVKEIRAIKDLIEAKLWTKQHRNAHQCRRRSKSITAKTLTIHVVHLNLGLGHAKPPVKTEKK